MELGFDYLLALQPGGGAAVAGRADTEPELAFVLLRLAEDITWLATAVDRETAACADSFALDEVGCVPLSALRDWARDSPTTAAPGIARSTLRFTANVLPDPDPDHPDTADTLEATRDQRLILAHAVHQQAVQRPAHQLRVLPARPRTRARIVEVRTLDPAPQQLLIPAPVHNRQTPSTHRPRGRPFAAQRLQWLPGSVPSRS
ncbi:hypothetical protein [Streptomyces rimosus]|uniref:hypothetical protein n=1 Tax=Streptomyces rimosus TaxID=1927 RepID=UPI00067A8063|nr:hypothetical protein [Streptomyces rimosus]